MNATRTPSDGLFGGIRMSWPANSDERVGHFKRDVRHSPHEVGNRRIPFEAHPFHPKFAFLVTDDAVSVAVKNQSRFRLEFLSKKFKKAITDQGGDRRNSEIGSGENISDCPSHTPFLPYA